MSHNDPPAANPPRSVLLVTQLWGRDGGVAAHVRASAELLAVSGVDVHVLVAEVQAGGGAPGVTIHHRPALFDARAPIAERLGDTPAAEPTVIHLHQRADPALVDALRAHAPLVVSAHGYAACTSGVHFFAPGHECTRAHGPGCVFNLTVRGCAHTHHLKPFPAKYRQAAQGLQTLRRADLALSYSSAVDRHLARNGIARRAVIPLFTTMAPTRGSGHEGRRRVVFAGRVAGPKGPGVLLHAAREVDAEFVLCGEGRQLPMMRRLARQLGIEERVRFTGWLAPDALARELAEASVVAMPSRWPEPFGLVGIEALSAGRPVVASATGGILDWLRDGVNGLGVRTGDAGDLARALNELLADPARQRAMGAAGSEMVAARFSPERHLGALFEAYQGA
ncbi:MAG TPA: glycosyltransferase family 4 protein [Solirubrobacteraceae bacterium]|jgi:glycosyltransferase involved in cell wall biosynthesis|nr:glycosyltransferase family 4 protein [Solirubrobacteraceae bacterium]